MKALVRFYPKCEKCGRYKEPTEGEYHVSPHGDISGVARHALELSDDFCRVCQADGLTVEIEILLDLKKPLESIEISIQRNNILVEE